MAQLLNLTSIPREAIFVIIAVPVSVAVGFAFGLLYERWYNFSAVHRINKRFEKLFEYVSQSLDRAESACRLFNQHPKSRQLDSTQQKKLETRTGKLTAELNRIAKSYRDQTDADQTFRKVTGKMKQSLKPTQQKLHPFQKPEWELTPLDERTGFPDAVAYQKNLQQLLKAMQQTGSKSAVLFIRLDHYTRHVKKYGAGIAEAFLKKTGSVVLRKLRHDDFITQITEDLLIAVVPDVLPESMQKLANEARKAVRLHRYVHPESDQEVFVTASFSYTLFDSTLTKNGIPEQELWDRCQNALAASQKQGRCQLHEMTDSGISRLIAG